jgi:nitroimidazol reductase NimA-like FMN-containing flavoprotein (pyridoxamine 5'-phosphate oxidase superfamily)
MSDHATPPDELIPTPRTRLRRRPQRGSHDRATLHAILDEGIVCHVGFREDDTPIVLPMVYGRVDDVLYLHGARANRMLGWLAEGAPACVSVTHLDGLVLARSAFHTSVNYRSAVLLGTARTVTCAQETERAFRAIVEHAVPGRWGDVRPPSAAELAATLLLRFPLEEGSAKIRSGGPIEDEADYAIASWAGVLPLRCMAGPAQDDGRLLPGVDLPAYVSGYRRPGVTAHGE